MQVPQEVAALLAPVERQPGTRAAPAPRPAQVEPGQAEEHQDHRGGTDHLLADVVGHQPAVQAHGGAEECLVARLAEQFAGVRVEVAALAATAAVLRRESDHRRIRGVRSEEHTSELQSLMRISYAVFCLKKK